MVQLPSGLVFKVTFASDPARPWSAVQVGSDWRIRRKRLGSVASGSSAGPASSAAPFVPVRLGCDEAMSPAVFTPGLLAHH